MNHHRACTSALLLLGILAAPAYGALDDPTVKLMGGTYAVDCAKDGGPRVTIGKDEIVVTDGTKKVTARNLETAASWYGPGMPDEYRVVLLSRVNDDPGLLFAVYEDKNGYYGVLDGDLTHSPGIRPELLKLRFRQCKAEPAKAKAPKAAPENGAKEEPKNADADLDGAKPAAPDHTAALRADKGFRAAYAKAMGPHMRERWIAVLDGPSPPTRDVRIDGTDYVMLASCKAHECADNSLVVVWSAGTKKLYGLVQKAGENEFVGAPPVPVAEGLQKLWQEEWGSATGSTEP